jgi:hypothetical protein
MNRGIRMGRLARQFMNANRFSGTSSRNIVRPIVSQLATLSTERTVPLINLSNISASLSLEIEGGDGDAEEPR